MGWSSDILHGVFHIEFKTVHAVVFIQRSCRKKKGRWKIKEMTSLPVEFGGSNTGLHCWKAFVLRLGHVARKLNSKYKCVDLEPPPVR